MSNRRVPLANVSNAANSPYRAAAVAATKRTRAQSTFGEASYEEQPPVKKHITAADSSNVQTPVRKQPIQPADGKVFTKRPLNSRPTAFERKLLASKERETQQRTVAQEKSAQESLEAVRQWQKHYRKVFPSFVFYFESIPEDIRGRCSRQIVGLGAREEKFFSKDVTHIVTTRAIPSGDDGNASTSTNEASVSNGSQTHSRSQTINPSLLDRSTEDDSQAQGMPPRNKFTFETSVGRRLQSAAPQDLDIRKQSASTSNILRRAQLMGMKIWQLEKLQKMMTTMYDTDLDFYSQHGHNTRSNLANTTGTAKPARDLDLSRMLRNEQLHGASDRDMAFSENDLIMFKGPHIYIRDMNEKTKPIMVREYPRAARREDGTWPQFRSVSHGKCPFIQELAPTKREIEREKMLEKRASVQVEANNTAAPRTRAAAAAALEAAKMRPPQAMLKRSASETEMGTNLKTLNAQQRPVEITHGALPSKIRSPDKSAKGSYAGIRPKLFGGEPVASGVQPSNITSAIRSQMISSTAAAPGAKAGISKEVHGLKRKVLEKNSAPSFNFTSTSQSMVGPSRVPLSERNPPNVRPAKRKAQERITHTNLVHIEEENTTSEDEADIARKAASKKIEAIEAKAGSRRELKPGYCENCREKFDDFDDHVIGRRHRKFALTPDNWKELDAILTHLVRPLKENDHVDG